MSKEYQGFKCNKCCKEFVLLRNQVSNGNVSCPYCSNRRTVVKTKETDSLKECMDHSSYVRTKHGIKQIK